MRIPIYVLGFGFVLSAVALTAQTAQQQQPTTPVNPSTPATQVGDGAQSKAGTPVQPTTTAPSTREEWQEPQVPAPRRRRTRKILLAA